MIIACLPSETTYDVQCPLCGRGFLFLTDRSDSDGAALRRTAVLALAAQHNQLKARSDRRRGGHERRVGMPDLRAQRTERRTFTADRRESSPDRRGTDPERRGTEHERRSGSPVFRRGSGAVHPRGTFYLQGWDGEPDRSSRAWADSMLLQQAGRC